MSVVRSDHVIPIDLGRIANSTSDYIEVGNSSFHRVVTVGKIVRKAIDLRLVLILTDGKGNELRVEKVYISTFPREATERFRIDDTVQVVGKVRVNRGRIFINAFSIRRCMSSQISCHESESKIAEEYYSKPKAATFIPAPASKEALEKELNIPKMGLSRFPMSLLENSSVTNNGNEWPEDLPIDMPANLRNPKPVVVPSPQEEDSFERPIPGAVATNVESKADEKAVGKSEAKPDERPTNEEDADADSEAESDSDAESYMVIMEKIDLKLDRSLLDAGFDGYKVSMDPIEFEKKLLEEQTAIVTRANHLISLQHMKLFAGDNQLFVDFRTTTEHLKHLYRFAKNGTLERVVYDTQLKTWTIGKTCEIDVHRNASQIYPRNVIFAEQSLIVIGDGLNEVHVYYMTEKDECLHMLRYKVANCEGISLADARVLNGNLEILMHRVDENPSGSKSSKFVTKIFWISVRLSDIDVVNHLTVLRNQEIIQEGHFETCFFDNFGNMISLAAKKPRIAGELPEIEEKHVERSWKQIEEQIIVNFKTNRPIDKNDINLNITKKSIFLTAKEAILLEGTLCGEIDETNVEIASNDTELVLKLKSTDGKRWNEIIEGESDLDEIKGAPSKKGGDEKVCGTDEVSEECDETEPSMSFYWMNPNTMEVFRQCDITGHQVVFVARDGLSPAKVCLRHDVDGIIWDFAEYPPKHLATLQAFGYVQASKTQRIWSGCSPHQTFAGIVESSNRVLLYSQQVSAGGILTNRKTMTRTPHVAKQYVLRIETSDVIRGTALFDSHMFALTDNAIYVAQLN
ncbi:unnamed protein product [Caenorhabditis bovis]|uniref:NudC domain-containing protein 1 n=1 Tax=Caenorhabditis bovis TaxID=2654633 RepID=A0A8S1F415_9PELO|nr:unnamed protein product [Caenorhabditis bovis]